MRLTGLAVVVGALLAAPVLGTSVFTDTFPTGVSGARWQVMTGSTFYQQLQGDNAHVRGGVGDQSAKQVDADPWIYYSRTTSGLYTTGPVTAGTTQLLTVYMFDDGNFTGGHPGNQPVAGGVMFASSDSSDFFQISVLSSAQGGYGYYNWRTSAQGTFSTGVARTQGWHKMQIEVLPYTGTNDVKFYIDNNLVATGNRKSAAQNLGFEQIRLGISVKTYAPFWYDDVNVTITPEPAALMLLAFGACFLRRRGA